MSDKVVLYRDDDGRVVIDAGDSENETALDLLVDALEEASTDPIVCVSDEVFTPILEGAKVTITDPEDAVIVRKALEGDMVSRRCVALSFERQTVHIQNWIRGEEGDELSQVASALQAAGWHVSHVEASAGIFHPQPFVIVCPPMWSDLRAEATRIDRFLCWLEIDGYVCSESTKPGSERRFLLVHRSSEEDDRDPEDTLMRGRHLRLVQ